MSNISNTKWNSIAFVVILDFILIPTTWTSLEKICWFISYDWAHYSFSDQMYNKIIWWISQKYWKLTEMCLNSLENHWILQTNRCSESAITLMQILRAACKNKDKLWLQFILSNKHWCVLCPSKMLEHVFFCFLCILMHEMHNAYYTISTLNLHSIRYICKIIFLIQGLTFFKIYWNGSSFLLI